MISQLLLRMLTPYIVGLLWLVAALVLLRPGDWPGNPIAAGVIGGLALVMSVLAIPPDRWSQAPAIRARRLAILGLSMIFLALIAALVSGAEIFFRLLSTPGGGLSLGAILLLLIEAGLALVLAAAIGHSAVRWVDRGRKK